MATLPQMPKMWPTGSKRQAMETFGCTIDLWMNGRAMNNSRWTICPVTNTSFQHIGLKRL